MYQYQNPINDFYLRNSQFNQQYNQPYMSFPNHQVQNQVNSRFVTNVEEARAAMIDPLSYNIFLDSSNGKIYLKKLGNNGQSEFLSYAVEEQKQVEVNPIDEINKRLSNIENFLGELKNDKSVSGNANNVESARSFTATVAEQNEINATAESAGFSKNAGNDKWKKR